MELTPRQFVAEVTKIFNMPSRGRTAEQRQFLHACGSLYKRKLSQKATNASNATVQSAILALDTELQAQTGAPLSTALMETSPDTCAFDHYADELLAALDAAAEPTITAESAALSALLTLGEFKSIDGEFGFELHSYMVGGRRMQVGGGLVDSLKKLGQTVCGLFTGGVKSADDSAGYAIDSVSAKITTPGFFKSVASNLGIAGVLFAGSRDPVITLAIRVVNQLNASLDISSYCGNVFLFGTNVASLMSSLVMVTPKIVAVMFLWKVISIVRETLLEVGVATVNKMDDIPTNDTLKAAMKSNLPGLYETILKRVLAAMGKKTTAAVATNSGSGSGSGSGSAAAAPPAYAPTPARVNTAVGTNVGRANAGVGSNVGRVNAGVGSNVGRVNTAVGTNVGRTNTAVGTNVSRVNVGVNASSVGELTSLAPAPAAQAPKGRRRGRASPSTEALQDVNITSEEVVGALSAAVSLPVEAVVVPTANAPPLQRSLSVAAASEEVVDLAPIQAATDATSLGVLAEAVEEYAAAESLSKLKRTKRGGRRTRRKGSKKGNKKVKKSTRK
jgi:hypothetical protein